MKTKQSDIVSDIATLKNKFLNELEMLKSGIDPYTGRPPIHQDKDLVNIKIEPKEKHRRSVC